MLIVLNLLIIAFILAMMAMWATYGFFSAFLHLVIVVVSGVIAFAFWEPIAYMLLSKSPAYAWGVGLLAPFVVTMIIARVLMDKYCKMNLKFPRLADQIGGSACGGVAGLLSIGMLMLGMGFMPVPPDLMGYQPYRMANNTVEPNDEGGLWVKPEQITGGFFNMLSEGSMAPTLSNTTLAVNKSGIAQRSAVYRLQDDPNQLKSASPESVKVLDVYAVAADPAALGPLLKLATVKALLNPDYKLADVPDEASPDAVVTAIVAEFNRRLAAEDENNKASAMLNMDAILEAARRIEFEGSPTEDLGALFDAVVQARAAELLDQLKRAYGPNKQLIVIDTEWNSNTPGTYNTDGWLRVAIPQIRLQTVNDDQYTLVPPVAYSLEINKLSGERVFVEMLSRQHFAAYAQDNDVKIGWIFAVPLGDAPYRFEARQLGFDLTQLDAVNVNPLATALALGAAELPEPEDETVEGGGTGTTTDRTNLNGTNIGASGVVAQLSERLPKTLSPNSATQIESNQDTEPWTAFRGYQELSSGAGGGGRVSRMQEIYVPANARLLRIEMDNDGAASLYGQARQLAANLQVMQIQDTTGNRHDAVAYVLFRKDGSQIVAIREFNGGTPMTSLRASQLPRPGPTDKLYVYFQVPVGRTLSAFLLGPERQDFEDNIEVVDK